MNPFTRFLAARLADPSLQALIRAWDELEALVIRVYKSGQATPEDEATYAHVRAWLTRHYAAWAPALQPHWQAALVAGIPAPGDPFLRLTAAVSALDFVGDWEAMQNLPAAREALNRLVLAGAV